MKYVCPVVPQRDNPTSGTNLSQRILPSAPNASLGLETSVETGAAECDPEAALAGSIEHLWLIDKNNKSNLKRSRQGMTENRVELAKRLFELKTLLGGRGRDGAWLPQLRRLGIPRSTAEGLVKRHMAGSPQRNAPDVLVTLTKQDIPKLLKAIRPKLVHVSTRELADQFLHELVVMLDDQIAQRTPLQSIDPVMSLDDL